MDLYLYLNLYWAARTRWWWWSWETAWSGRPCRSCRRGLKAYSRAWIVVLSGNALCSRTERMKTNRTLNSTANAWSRVA
jgi:hypothetical protein